MISFLEYLKESSTPLAKELQRKFGKKTLISHDPLGVKVQDETIKEIYNSLNAHLFENKLEIVPIWYETYHAIKNELTRRDPDN